MARSFFINNKPVLVTPDWGISDKINTRTTMDITIIDLLELETVEIGDSVVVYNNESKIFGGTIESISIEETSPGFIEYNASCVDFSSLADKRLIAESVINTLAGDIIKNYILPILSSEGIIAGTIENGPVISKAVFNYINCSEALDYIKDVTGFNWYIDFDKKLNFFARDKNLALITLSDNVPHIDFQVSKTRNQYRNRQYLIGGKGRTSTTNTEIPSPKPDGSSRSFILRFPVAERPIIKINGITVPEDNIGVNGLDKDKAYYFTYGSNTITQDDSQVVLTSSDTIEITYYGLYPIMVIADNPSEINNIKNKEVGTSGIYEMLSSKKSLDQREQALEYAQGLLFKYGLIPTTVSFKTDYQYLKAGELLPIQKPLYKINDSYLIESINISLDGQDVVYDVKCLDGASLGGWEEFFKTVVESGKEYVINGDEVLLLLTLPFEKTGISGEIDITIYECLYPSENLYPSVELYPGNIKKEDDLID